MSEGRNPKRQREGLTSSMDASHVLVESSSPFGKSTTLLTTIINDTITSIVKSSTKAFDRLHRQQRQLTTLQQAKDKGEIPRSLRIVTHLPIKMQTVLAASSSSDAVNLSSLKHAESLQLERAIRAKEQDIAASKHDITIAPLDFESLVMEQFHGPSLTDAARAMISSAITAATPQLHICIARSMRQVAIRYQREEEARQATAARKEQQQMAVDSMDTRDSIAKVVKQEVAKQLKQQRTRNPPSSTPTGGRGNFTSTSKSPTRANTSRTTPPPSPSRQRDKHLKQRRANTNPPQKNGLGASASRSRTVGASRKAHGTTSRPAKNVRFANNAQNGGGGAPTSTQGWRRVTH